MSGLKRPGRLAPIFAIAVLMMGIASQALAQPSFVVSPPAVQPGGIISPTPVPAHAAKTPVNVTSGVSTAGKRIQIGNISVPPAINRSATAQPVRQAVNDARISLAKRTADAEINRVVNQLQLYKDRVSYSSLSDDEKSGINSLADSNIAWFQQQDSAIQAAGDLSSIQDIMTQVNQQTIALKANILKDAGILACDGLDAKIATAQNASASIAARIAALPARINGSAAENAKLSAYNVCLANASQYSSAARADFGSITGSDNAEAEFNAGCRQIGLADQAMSQAYDDLKGVYLWYLPNARAR